MPSPDNCNLSLGILADPRELCAPIVVSEDRVETRIRQYQEMCRIRIVEELIGELVKSGEINCPCHLGIGQEAIATGLAEHLRNRDRLFGNHRSHSHYLAIGGSVQKLFAEVLGRVGGCSKGMGGSMHLYSPEQGLSGTVPIVGGTIPLAVGAALSIKLSIKFSGRDDIAVCFFGDGAVEEGVFHESLNFAALHKLPVLFVCENNLYSSHLDVSLRQPYDRMGRFADAQGVLARSVDGNDISAVDSATADLVSALRRGEGPAFLEAVTYRHCGHVGPDANIDVGLRRKQEDLDAWIKRDPIARLRQGLILKNFATAEQLSEIEHCVRNSCQADMELARQEPFPPASLLLEAVYLRQGV